MKLYFSLTKKRLLILFSGTVILLLIIAEWISVRTVPKNALTNALRVRYAENHGYVIGSTAACVQTIIPDDLSLNDRLLPFCGCRITVYRYPLKDRRYTDLDLLVYNGRIIDMRLINYNKEDMNGKNQTGSISRQPTANQPQ